MSLFSDLLDAWPGLLAVGAGTGLLYLFGRDPKGADEHNVSDYHEPPEVNAPPASLRRYEALDSQRIPATMRVRYDFDISPEPADVLPAAPAGMNAGSPLYAGMLFDTWHPEDPAVTAARFLREIGQSKRAKAGIRPAVDHWAVLDGSCYDDCPACARDLTGAFPVVAVA